MVTDFYTNVVRSMFENITHSLRITPKFFIRLNGSRTLNSYNIRRVVEHSTDRPVRIFFIVIVLEHVVGKNIVVVKCLILYELNIYNN